MYDKIIKYGLPEGVTELVCDTSFLVAESAQRIIASVLFMQLPDFEFDRLANSIKSKSQFVKQYYDTDYNISLFQYSNTQLLFKENLTTKHFTLSNRKLDYHSLIREEITSITGEFRKGCVLVDKNTFERFLVLKCWVSSNPYNDILAKITVRKLLPSIQYEEAKLVGEIMELTEIELVNYSVEKDTFYVGGDFSEFG